MPSLSGERLPTLPRGDNPAPGTDKNNPEPGVQSICLVEELQRFTLCGWSVRPANKVYQGCRVVRYGL